MPSYRLTYFQGKGRAEVARFIFAQAGVEYEDKRITGEEFQAMKDSLPTGMLPLLEVDGNKVFGSGPMTRYLANAFGLAGGSDLQKTFTDCVNDVLDDLVAKMVAAYFGPEDSKAKAMEDLKTTHIPKYFSILEKIISNSEGDWATGSDLTYVDLRICVVADEVFKQGESLGAMFPKLKGVNDAVKALPNIAKWIEKRPKSDF